MWYCVYRDDGNRHERMGLVFAWTTSAAILEAERRWGRSWGWTYYAKTKSTAAAVYRSAWGQS